MPSYQERFAALENSFALDKHALNKLVLNFLIHEGYQDTVIKFAKEVGIQFDDPENAELLIGMNSMKVRSEIKHKLLKGEISEAIDELNLLYPDLLEQNNFLYFKLLLLNLIEMIRTNQSGADKEQFIMTVIKFAQDKLTNKAVKNVKFMEELELTMTLLIYSNHKEMLPPRLNELFEVKLRRDISDLVNKFILLKEMETMIDVNYKGKFKTEDFKIDNNDQEDEQEDDEMMTIQVIDSKLKKLIKLWVWLENKVHLSYTLDVPLFKLDEEMKAQEGVQ